MASATAPNDIIDCDYVVIGAGSAGCVVAHRLSADGHRVVVLEAGPRDTDPMIHIPAAILTLLHKASVNWNYATDPEAGANGRRIHWPRGKVLGGSSSINGMLFVRGNAADFDGWAQMGCTGWSFDDCLPHFKNMEHYTGDGDAFRGTGGPLRVEDHLNLLPLTELFVQAAQQAGIPFTPDLNSAERARQEGVGYTQMSRIGRRRGSTAQTFLAQARRSGLVRIETEALATGLRFDGKRCTGVAFRQHGLLREVRARREVVLSGGSINSPHLLQVSGIGPADHLQSIGVDVVHDLPGVGGNLSDHYATRLAIRVKDQVSINEYARGPRLAGQIARWLVKGDGALTFGVSSAIAFCRSREGLASPDIQLLFTPASYDPKRFGDLERVPGATIAASIARPESRGTIMATGPDPFARPSIKPNYLSAPNDITVGVAGLRRARDIFNAPAMAPYKVAETVPGDATQSKDEMLAFMRENGTTLYHPVGTCKMGAATGSDPMAVTDPRLKVRGIDGLRVVDASIMPTVSTGNTNATTIMIGEKGASMIREDAA